MLILIVYTCILSFCLAIDSTVADGTTNPPDGTYEAYDTTNVPGLTCCDAIEISGFPTGVQLPRDGTFVKVEGIIQDHLPVYRNEDGQYLYYWSEYQDWRIGTDYTKSNAGVATSEEKYDCPESYSTWQVYTNEAVWLDISSSVSVACTKYDPVQITDTCYSTTQTGKDCKDRVAITFISDISFQQCMDRCNSNDQCTGFDYYPSYQNGYCNCFSNTNCYPLSTNVAPYEDSMHQMKIPCLKNSYSVLPSVGKCPHGSEVTEEECENLGNQSGFSNWVQASTWDLPETCGCYIDQDGNRYFNRLSGACDNPDVGELMICKHQDQTDLTTTTTTTTTAIPTMQTSEFVTVTSGTCISNGHEPITSRDVCGAAKSEILDMDCMDSCLLGIDRWCNDQCASNGGCNNSPTGCYQHGDDFYLSDANCGSCSVSSPCVCRRGNGELTTTTTTTTTTTVEIPADRNGLECWTAGGCTGDTGEVCEWCGLHEGEEQICCNGRSNYLNNHPNCNGAQFNSGISGHQCVVKPDVFIIDMPQGNCPSGWLVPHNGRSTTNWGCCEDCIGSHAYCYSDCGCKCSNAERCEQITMKRDGCFEEVGCMWADNKCVNAPTYAPSKSPSMSPVYPTVAPSRHPTKPTETPSKHPSEFPITEYPSFNPSIHPSKKPTTPDPTRDPSIPPSMFPTYTASSLFYFTGDCESQGDCVSSKSYPFPYNHYDECSVTMLRNAEISVQSPFSISTGSTLYIGDQKFRYSHETPPETIRRGETIEWDGGSWGANDSKGWKLCFTEINPPSCSGNRDAYDAGYGGCTSYVEGSTNFNHCGTDSDDGITASLTCSECGECVDRVSSWFSFTGIGTSAGDCESQMQGDCISSKNYPLNYHYYDYCEVTILQDADISVDSPFSISSGSAFNFGYIGVEYSDDVPDTIKAGDRFTWHVGGWGGTGAGWRLCFSQPTTTPTSAPTSTTTATMEVVELINYCTSSGCTVRSSFGSFSGGSVKVSIRGDFSETNEYADIWINGNNMGRCNNEASIADCSTTWFTCGTYNDIQQGPLTIEARTSYSVDFNCASYYYGVAQMKSEIVPGERLSLVVQISGVNNGNKDSVCSSFATALSGVVTHCSFEGPSLNRRQLQSSVPLYMDIQVSDSQASQTVVETTGFPHTLTGLPASVTVSSVNVFVATTTKTSTTTTLPETTAPSSTYSPNSFFSFTGDCESQANCISSSNYTNTYNDYDYCQVTMLHDVDVSVEWPFSVTDGTLYIDNQRVQYDFQVPDTMESGLNIQWSAGNVGYNSGWKLCFTQPMEPTYSNYESCSTGTGETFLCNGEMSNEEIARRACESVYDEEACEQGSCGGFRYYYNIYDGHCTCSKSYGAYEFIFENNGEDYVGGDLGYDDNEIVTGNDLFVRWKYSSSCYHGSGWALTLAHLGEEVKSTFEPTYYPTYSSYDKPISVESEGSSKTSSGTIAIIVLGILGAVTYGLWYLYRNSSRSKADDNIQNAIEMNNYNNNYSNDSYENNTNTTTAWEPKTVQIEDSWKPKRDLAPGESGYKYESDEEKFKNPYDDLLNETTYEPEPYKPYEPEPYEPDTFARKDDHKPPSDHNDGGNVLDKSNDGMTDYDFGFGAPPSYDDTIQHDLQTGDVHLMEHLLEKGLITQNQYQDALGSTQGRC